MSETITVALISGGFAALIPICTFFGVWLERRVKHKNADAALQTSEAAKECAEAAQSEAEAAKRQADAALVAAVAEMRRAVSAERENADANWARFCDAQDRTIDTLRVQVEKNSSRISQAEMRAEAAELRASKAEHLYSMAVFYMRRVVAWINVNLPGENYPEPPPELLVDL